MYDRLKGFMLTVMMIIIMMLMMMKMMMMKTVKSRDKNIIIQYLLRLPIAMSRDGFLTATPSCSMSQSVMMLTVIVFVAVI